ncbi:hypothetical protein PG993_008024 [Apiospora rasikravindrae]|uniref:Uncharacterized protein n=1 Tax=Apiospora rasikravindrae TaxID=990691 RepID=A0ABR1SZ54_9PEZI
MNPTTSKRELDAEASGAGAKPVCWIAGRDALAQLGPILTTKRRRLDATNKVLVAEIQAPVSPLQVGRCQPCCYQG